MSHILNIILLILLAPITIFASSLVVLAGIPIIAISLFFANNLNHISDLSFVKIHWLKWILRGTIGIFMILASAIGFPFILLYFICFRYLQWTLAVVTEALHYVLPFIPATQYPEKYASM